jgi:hypothetical protein
VSPLDLPRGLSSTSSSSGLYYPVVGPALILNPPHSSSLSITAPTPPVSSFGPSLFTLACYVLSRLHLRLCVEPTSSPQLYNPPQATDILAHAYYNPMAAAPSAQPIALPSSSTNHNDINMSSGSFTGQSGSFNAGSYARRFIGSPISFRAGSFGSRFYPGVSPGQVLGGPLE